MIILRKFTSLLLPATLIFASCGDGKEPDATAVDSTAISSTVDTSASSLRTDPMENSDPGSIPDDTVFNDGSVPSSWANAGFTDSAAVKRFVKQLQSWTAANQVDSIAAQIAFPLKNPAVKNVDEFKAGFEKYFTSEVKSAIADQKLSQIFRNQQGAMIGQGRVWLTEKNKTIKIFAINK
ncbi:MAG: hypothetical protein EOO02_02985 [Chitinophagaceae bacterium]|nr:MAG: hypothetical protein EOO02_02985 [Chitinophagaceae bacterium]